MWPYPCWNPATLCPSRPGVNTLNARLMGCMALTNSEAPAGGGSGGGGGGGGTPQGPCLLQGPAPVRCDSACPQPCQPGESWDTCRTRILTQAGDATEAAPTVPCFGAAGSYYHDQALWLLHSVPLGACTGACAGGGSGCCAGATIDVAAAPDATMVDLGPDAHTTGGGAAAADVAAAANVRDLLTQFFTFARLTCMCPHSVNAHGALALQPCSGAGACVWQGSATGPADRLDPAQYACKCVGGASGRDCGSSVNHKTCPAAWDDATGTLTPCGGPTHGTCNASTKNCACTPGFTGDACGLVACPVTADGGVCNGAGACSVLGACACAPGFHGVGCQCTTDAATGQEHCVPLLKDSGSSTTPPPAAASGPGNGAALALVIGVGVAGLLVLGLLVGLWVHTSRSREAASNQAANNAAVAAALRSGSASISLRTGTGTGTNPAALLTLLLHGDHGKPPQAKASAQVPARARPPPQPQPQPAAWRRATGQ